MRISRVAALFMVLAVVGVSDLLADEVAYDMQVKVLQNDGTPQPEVEVTVKVRFTAHSYTEETGSNGVADFDDVMLPGSEGGTLDILLPGHSPDLCLNFRVEFGVESVGGDYILTVDSGLEPPAPGSFCEIERMCGYQAHTTDGDDMAIIETDYYKDPPPDCE